jgi:hypothetical protein
MNARAPTENTHATSNHRLGSFLLVASAGIWHLAAQAGLPVLLELLTPRIEWRHRAKFSCRARHAVPLLKTNNAIAR